MPRKQFEIVQDWPKLVAGLGYLTQIREAEKITDPFGMRVVLEFTDGEQAGRTMPVVLPLPCRPEGLTASCLQACGLNAAVGSRFTPRNLVGRTVVAFFATKPDGQLTVARFEACPAGAGG